VLWPSVGEFFLVFPNKVRQLGRLLSCDCREIIESIISVGLLQTIGSQSRSSLLEYQLRFDLSRSTITSLRKSPIDESTGCSIVLKLLYDSRLHQMILPPRTKK
jgi:hypothetical protein